MSEHSPLDEALVALAQALQTEPDLQARRRQTQAQQVTNGRTVELWEFGHSSLGTIWRGLLDLYDLPRLRLAVEAQGPARLWLLRDGDHPLAQSRERGAEPRVVSSLDELLELGVDWRIAGPDLRDAGRSFVQFAGQPGRGIDLLLSQDVETRGKDGLVSEWIQQVVAALPGGEAIPNAAVPTPLPAISPELLNEPASAQVLQALKNLVWQWAHSPSVAHVRKWMERNGIEAAVVFAPKGWNSLALVASGDLPLQLWISTTVRGLVKCPPSTSAEQLAPHSSADKEWLACYLELAKALADGSADHWLAQSMAKNNRAALAAAQARHRVVQAAARAN